MLTCHRVVRERGNFSERPRHSRLTREYRMTVMLRLVFTSVGVGVGVVSGVVSSTESESEESERFHFLPTPLMIPSLTICENQIVGVGSRSGRINQSRCSFPRFMIGLVLPLLLTTPTNWFYRKRRKRKRKRKLCLRLRCLIFTRS